MDRVTIASLLPLLLPGDGTKGPIDFDADLYGGTARGSYEDTEETIAVSLDASGLDLSRYAFATEDFNLRLTGILGVDADLTINKKRIRESNGMVHLSLKDLSIQKGSTIKGFDIPMTLAFTFSGGEAAVDKGRVQFEDLTLESAPLTIKVNGSIMLNRTLSRCRFNLKVAMKFGDDLAVVAAFLSSSAKSDDGYYHYVLSGPLERLRTRPDRLAARRAGAGRKKKSLGPSRPDDEETFRPGLPRPRGTSSTIGGTRRRSRPPILDSEERRRLREERRKRAEERRKRRQALREARMRELEARRNLGGEGEEPYGELPPVDVIPPVPGVDRYRDYDESPGEPQGEPANDQQLEPVEDLGPDLPQDVPGDWEEPPE